MRLVVTFGYQKVLFPKGCDYSTVIDAVGRAQMVEDSGPYDARVYTPSSQLEIDVKLINDDDVRLPDAVRSESLDKIIELATERDTLKLKVYNLEKKLKAFEDLAQPPTEK